MMCLFLNLLERLKTGLVILALLFWSQLSHATSLEQFIEFAINNDPIIKRSELMQSSLIANSVAAKAWDDPKVTLGLANLPLDSLHFNNEAMTQLKVGFSQVIPRGESQAIKGKIIKLKAEQEVLIRAAREAQLKRDITLTWLEVVRFANVLNLINEDIELFEQMFAVAQSNYASGLANTLQHDVIDAELELLQLRDRLLEAEQGFESAKAALMRWGISENIERHAFTTHLSLSISDFRAIPQLKLRQKFSDLQLTLSEVPAFLKAHPEAAIQAILTHQSNEQIRLAKQSYQPQWQLNASAAHRQDSPSGMSRSDFLSVGVTFDMPIFTEQKQDLWVQAAKKAHAATTYSEIDTIRRLSGHLHKAIATLQHLDSRQALYRGKLLPQRYEQADAVLSAYQHDNAQLADVLRARINALNSRVSLLNIDIDALKQVAIANYFLPSLKRDNNI